MTDFTSIDMTGANLTGVDFSESTLTNAILQNTALNGIDLSGSTLAYADLTCARAYYEQTSSSSAISTNCTTPAPTSTLPSSAANFQSTTLTQTIFAYATLDYAMFSSASMNQTNFRNASFKNANLQASSPLNSAIITTADFQNAIFDAAKLNGLVFGSSNLEGASFKDLQLQGTSFVGAIMPNVDFSGTNTVLEQVDFSASILQNANFSNATLQSGGENSGVTFSCAQMGGSNFTNSVVTQANFVNAVMPAAADCCPAVEGFQNCGTIAATGDPYGPVTFPDLTTEVACPNGDPAICDANQWKIPNWTTSSCTNPPSTQIMWSEPDCGTAPSDLVVFTDPNLEACVLASLPGDPTSITITTAAKQLSLSCADQNISDLGGLENFTGLVSLDLTANEITEFSTSFSFPDLTELKLGYNKLATLNMSKISSVTWLEIPQNCVSKGDCLSSITGIEDTYFENLDASGNSIVTFDLSIQNELVFADLSDNVLTTVLDSFNTDLSALSKLETLNLQQNELTDIGPLDTIAHSLSENPQGKLVNLYMACNPDFTCSSLSLDGSYTAYQTSQCADFNSQTRSWDPIANPNCPNQ